MVPEQIIWLKFPNLETPLPTPWFPESPPKSLHHQIILKLSRITRYYLQLSSRLYLQRLGGWWSKWCAKDIIPESTGYTKTVLVVHEVVLEMVFLQVLPISGEGFMVQEVMRQVVADVSENTATKHGRCNSFIPVKDGMRKFVKGYREGEK